MKQGTRAIIYIAFAFLLNGCLENKPNLVADDPKVDYRLGNYSRAFSGLYLKARQGDPEAQYAIGYMYYTGLGTDKNQDAGLAWIRRSADKNNPKAIAALRSIVGDHNTQQEGMLESQTASTKRALATAKQVHAKQTLTTQSLLATPPPAQGINWIRQQNPAHYTVTFRAEASPFHIENLIKQIKQGPISEYRLRTSGRIQYSAALGSFTDVKSAQHCLDNLPNNARQRAIVMSWSEIQAVMLP
jgi:hypothetical protein